jgi:hypothetical protein
MILLFRKRELFLFEFSLIRTIMARFFRCDMKAVLQV